MLAQQFYDSDKKKKKKYRKKQRKNALENFGFF